MFRVRFIEIIRLIAIIIYFDRLLQFYRVRHKLRISLAKRLATTTTTRGTEQLESNERISRQPIIA